MLNLVHFICINFYQRQGPRPPLPRHMGKVRVHSTPKSPTLIDWPGEALSTATVLNPYQVTRCTARTVIG
jgi:hypothetical protein